MPVKANKAEVVRIFREMADFLAVQGESIFRIRAYERAADAVEHFGGNVEELLHQGKLNQISGIGKGMLDKIERIITTGVLSEHQELKSTFPPGLMEILSVPDVGPKTAKVLYEKLGIKSVEELEEAAKKGELRELPGFGAKKEETILRGIKFYGGRTSRILLGKALPQVELLISELEQKASPLIEKISPAGSLRRGRETIGDIDLLVTSPDPLSLMHVFTNLSFVDTVLAQGETKSSVRTTEGLQVDLRVVAADCFGAAIQYFTGSKSHNIKLRERAIKIGLKINEYGVFTRDGKKIAGNKEAEVYAALDLPLIPPELREDRGEIEAAEKNVLPQLVTEQDLKGDLHIHTQASDGMNEIEELVEKAKEKGYQYIAITDHSTSLKVAGGLSPEAILAQIDTIKKISAGLHDMKLLAGAEVNVKLDGSLDLPDNLLSKLDIVIAAIHTGFKQDEKNMTERVIKAMRHPRVHILAHPSGRLLGERDAYAINLDKVLDIAREEEVWLEINSQPDRLDLDDYWAREAKQRGVKIVINSDAHSKESLDFMKFGVITARRGWLEKEDVINTLSLAELMQKL